MSGDAEHDAIEKTKAPLLDHLEELRKRLLWSLAAFVVAFFVCYAFSDRIYALLVEPLAPEHMQRYRFIVDPKLPRNIDRLTLAYSMYDSPKS